MSYLQTVNISIDFWMELDTWTVSQRPRKGQRRDRGALTQSEADCEASLPANRPAIALACGMRSSSWLRCVS